MKNLFEREEENYYKPIRANNFWSNNYTEYESNGDRNETLSVEEYLKKFRLYLKDIVNNLKKSDTWKIDWTVANNFISFIVNDEECVMNSEIENIEIMISDEADKVLKELFDSLKISIKKLKSMKDSEFVFYYVHLMY